MGSPHDILKDALALTPHERAELAVRLLESLDSAPTRTDDDGEDALAREVTRRLDELTSGAVQPVERATAMAAARAAIRRT